MNIFLTNTISDIVCYNDYVPFRCFICEEICMNEKENTIQIPDTLFLDTFLYFCGDPRDADPERRERIVKGLEKKADEICELLCNSDVNQVDEEFRRKYLSIINLRKKKN